MTYIVHICGCNLRVCGNWNMMDPEEREELFVTTYVYAVIGTSMYIL